MLFKLSLGYWWVPLIPAIVLSIWDLRAAGGSSRLRRAAIALCLLLGGVAQLAIPAAIALFLLVILLWSGETPIRFQELLWLLLVFGGPLFACALLLFSRRRWILYVVIGLASLELLALGILALRA